MNTAELTLRENISIALRKRTVPKGGFTFLYYFGGLALLLVGVQLVTGLLLLFYYVPTPEAAHASVRKIIDLVPYGAQIRSLHVWSSHGAIACGVLHLFGLFFTRSYTTPRKSLWVTWVVMLLLLFAAGFTGSLLPWDRTAYSATRIGTDLATYVPIVGEPIAELLRGGKNITAMSLTRFFGFHVALIPLLLVTFVILHSFLVFLFGRPRITGAPEEPMYPGYLLKEAMIWLGGLGVLFILAFLFVPGLGQPYDLQNPSEPPANVRPAWYFLFLYQLLTYLPEWATILIAFVITTFWIAVPWLDEGRQFKKRLVVRIAGILTALLFVVLTALAYFSKAE